MKDKEKNIKKATNHKVRALLEERKKRAKQKKAAKAKKLKVSDIKHGEGAHLGHMLARVRAKEVQLTFVCVVICLAVVLTSCYFAFSAVRDHKDYSTISVGSFDVSFNDMGEVLGNIVDLSPVVKTLDMDGVKQDPYQVQIKNTSDKTKTFQIRLVKDSDMIREDGCKSKQLSYQYLHYLVDDGKVESLSNEVKKSPVLVTTTLDAGEEVTHSIRIWVSTEIPDQYIDYHYHAKLVVKEVK